MSDPSWSVVACPGTEFNVFLLSSHGAAPMPHNGSRISSEPLLKSFGEGTKSAAMPHEPPASEALVPQA